ncbi:MAG: hypothetical protein KZQ97_02975 [Candidatus Thiodiazotropha sp. (ex Dulcina madagascariensis)]|nr:hypothetical protein [Candidatus Thiodiazotropha sp. (ex Dulcina madagascariensis)]
MLTPNRVAVALIVLFIIAFASWSKLRFVDEKDLAAQRWRIDEYPRFQQNREEFRD